jgi:hypothetical protein
MKIDIRQSSLFGSYNMYVNGYIAVSYESMTVCDNIKSALLNMRHGGSYSEGSEIADTIRATFIKQSKEGEKV